jgi:hypothetical protein
MERHDYCSDCKFFSFSSRKETPEKSYNKAPYAGHCGLHDRYVRCELKDQTCWKPKT